VNRDVIITFIVTHSTERTYEVLLKCLHLVRKSLNTCPTEKYFNNMLLEVMNLVFYIYYMFLLCLAVFEIT
jgi:hypothetical protein